MQLDLRDRRAALIVVDIMAELAPGAAEERALPVVGAAEAIPNAVRVLAAARHAGLPVIHFKEVHRKEMVDFGRELDGAMTDVCVHYTYADAHQRDHVVHVVDDAVYGSSWPAHDASLAAMEYLQHGARITTDQLCDHLLATTALEVAG